MDFTEVLKIICGALPVDWPSELPPESESQTEAFWMAACREEMRTRKTLSGKIRTLLEMKQRPALTSLEGWLLRRRVDWALQLGMDRFERRILPPVPLPEVLRWALVDNWESDGCQSMWIHAERGGKQHPQAPRWTRGLE